jgi:hypothetical protein
VSNKTREVFTYIYSHPEILDKLVKHVYNKSITDVLVRLLNVSDSVMEEGYEGSIDTIRASFIFKVVERLHEQYSLEDHLNA